MFIPYAARVVGSLVADKRLPTAPRVLELGAQTYSVDQHTIYSIAQELIEKGDSVRARTVQDRLAFARPARTPRESGVPHVREFFEALGFESYTAIDIGDYDGNVVMDLNTIVANTYGFTETYDLITNIGVSEHLINQAAFFENAHRATKVGGYMLHILPSLGYLNHGFFNYQPRFFEDLAAANGYTFEAFAFVDRTHVLVDLMAPNFDSLYLYDWLHLRGAGDAENTFIVALMKKESESDFLYPLQGKYYPDVSTTDVARAYDSTVRKTLLRSPPKGLFEVSVEPQPVLVQVRLRIKRKILRILRTISQIVLQYL